MQNQNLNAGNSAFPENVQTVSVSDISQGEPPKASSHVVKNVLTKNSESLQPDVSDRTNPKPDFDLKNYRDKSGQKFRTWKGHYLDESGKPAETKGGYLKVDKAKAEKSGFFQKAKDSVNEFFHRNKDPEAELEPENKSESGQTFREGSHIPNFSDFEPHETPGVACSKNSTIVAQQTVALEETLAIMLFSEEWQFLDRERQGLVNAWSRYYEQTGIEEMPLWVEMAAAHMVIVTNRMNRPKTKERFGNIKRWFIRKWVDLKTRKSIRPVESDQENDQQKGDNNATTA